LIHCQSNRYFAYHKRTDREKKPNNKNSPASRQTQMENRPHGDQAFSEKAAKRTKEKKEKKSC
jgi:hypothetical protein